MNKLEKSIRRDEILWSGHPNRANSAIEGNALSSYPDPEYWGCKAPFFRQPFGNLMIIARNNTLIKP